MSETKNDTEARAKREIEQEHGPASRELVSKDALIRERVKNLELRQEIAELQEELDDWKGLL